MVHIECDASFHHISGVGGCAFIITTDDREYVGAWGGRYESSLMAEFDAAIHALQFAKELGYVEGLIHTDNVAVAKCNRVQQVSTTSVKPHSVARHKFVKELKRTKFLVKKVHRRAVKRADSFSRRAMYATEEYREWLIGQVDYFK